jgi:hypothetical protein
MTAPDGSARPNGAAARVQVMSPQTARARRGSPPLAVAGERDLAGVNEVLASSLVRAQRLLALRLFAVFGAALGGLPALFALAPSVAEKTVYGAPLPWLLLGVIAFPLLFVLGVLYARLAERNEREFAELYDRS